MRLRTDGSPLRQESIYAYLCIADFGRIAGSSSPAAESGRAASLYRGTFPAGTGVKTKTVAKMSRTCPGSVSKAPPVFYCEN
jgi:hypothetical protein